MIPDAYALEALQHLLSEFSFTDSTAVDSKIRKQLSRKKLGKFDPVALSHLRELKNVVQGEFHLASKSHYFTQTHGRYCDVRDFDLVRLATDMAVKFPKISRAVIEEFLPIAAFYYYLK